MYGTGGKLKREPKLIGNEGFLPRDAPMGMNSLTRAFEGLAMRSAARGNQHVGKYAVHAKMSAADVVSSVASHSRIGSFNETAIQISWSGCKDSQTSADTYEQGTATGAMSYVCDSILFAPAMADFANISLGIHEVVEYVHLVLPNKAASYLRPQRRTRTNLINSFSVTSGMLFHY